MNKEVLKSKLTIFTVIIGYYQWLWHLFWMFGRMYYHFITLNIGAVEEIYYFIDMHLNCKSTLMYKRKMPFWMAIKNNLIALFGFMLPIVLLLFIGLLIRNWL